MKEKNCREVERNIEIKAYEFFRADNTKSFGKRVCCAIPAQISMKNSTEKDIVHCPASFTALRKSCTVLRSYCQHCHDDLLVLSSTQNIKLKQ